VLTAIYCASRVLSIKGAKPLRAICICDSSEKSFTVQYFHSGFSEAQYFHSTDSKQTLIVPLIEMKYMPAPLQVEIDDQILSIVEELFPKPTWGTREYKFYNSF
jgi:hypothetical protein